MLSLQKKLRKYYLNLLHYNNMGKPLHKINCKDNIHYKYITQYYTIKGLHTLTHHKLNNISNTLM